MGREHWHEYVERENGTREKLCVEEKTYTWFGTPFRETIKRTMDGKIVERRVEVGKNDP